mgnify:CR=1 FL=1
MKKVTELVAQLAQEAVEQAGCRIWDTEYVREGGQWYLRLYLDKDGGVDITDCEAVSRRVSDLLDEADPIPESYIFEVCSAGAERALKRPSDFQQFMGSPILLRLYKARDGRKEFPGTLTGYDQGAVLMEAGGETLRFEKDEIALARLRIEF